MFFNIKEIVDKQQLYLIKNKLSFLKNDYPQFCNWFDNKIISEITSEKRKVILASTRLNDFAGVLILKNTFSEKKICTLYVSSEIRNRKLGDLFFNIAFDKLGTDKPMITISDYHAADFYKLLGKYKFDLSEIIPDYYRIGVSEYSYNGHLYISKQFAA